MNLVQFNDKFNTSFDDFKAWLVGVQASLVRFSLFWFQFVKKRKSDAAGKTFWKFSATIFEKFSATIFPKCSVTHEKANFFFPNLLVLGSLVFLLKSRTCTHFPIF